MSRHEKLATTTLEMFLNEKVFVTRTGELVSPKQVIESRFQYDDIWKQILESIRNAKQPINVLWPPGSSRPTRICDNNGLYRLTWARFADIESVSVYVQTVE
jgi:hypothetical protein